MTTKPQLTRSDDAVTVPPPTGPMATQPVITITMITSFVSAILAGMAMLVDLPPDTEKVVLGIITTAWPIVTAAWTWHRVYAPASVQKVANTAAETGVASVRPELDVMDERTWTV